MSESESFRLTEEAYNLLCLLTDKRDYSEDKVHCLMKKGDRELIKEALMMSADRGNIRVFDLIWSKYPIGPAMLQPAYELCLNKGFETMAKRMRIKCPTLA
jgi:hypothetical protein